MGIANDSFASFTNTGFVNSTILPLVDSNLGAIFQYVPGDDSYALVLEYGRVEYTPWDATHQNLGGTAEYSCGATFKPFSAREDDFIGLSYGLFKHRNSTEKEEPTAHNREHVLELMYNFQLNDHVKIVPHYQYIHHPAYRADISHASLFGLQTVISF